MGWELIGGDPAPGSPESVRTAATALKSVAELAAEVLQSLTQETAEVGVERWKGTAADTFRQDIAHLPDSLKDVERSYDEASKALLSYEGTLERAQYDARAALTAATQAAADRDQAKSRRDSAQHNADALRSQRRGAAVRLESLRLQQSVSLDPVHRSSLDSPIASTRSQVSRLDADVADADHAVARQTAAINEAEDRLRRASGQADGIRKEISDAVDRAVAALKQAERDAHLPSWLQRTEADLKQDWKTYSPVLAESVHKLEAEAVHWLQTDGPKVIEVFDKAQTVFALLALIPTPLSGVFAAAALACGVTALAVSAGVDFTKPGGITAGDAVDLGTRFLGVLAGGAAMRAAKVAATEGAAAAKGWNTATRVLNDAHDVGGIVHEGIEHGPQGAFVAAEGYVLGQAGSALGAKVLRGVVAQANKSDAMQGALRHMSDSLGNADSGHTLSVTESEDIRTSQSLLAQGTDIKGGRFLPGNQAGAGIGGESNQALSGDALDDKLSDGFQKTGDFLHSMFESKVDQAETSLRAHLGEKPSSQPEYDFDLDPSPYGGTP